MRMVYDTPQLQTERMILRGPREDDFEAVLAFMSSERSHFVGGPMTDRFLSWRSFLAVMGHWALRGYGFFTLEMRDTGALAGRVGVIRHDGWPEAELGWHVFDGFEGRGLAYEAALAVRDWAWRERKMGPLISQINPENAPSIRLAKRLGATLESQTVLLGHPCLVYRHPAMETEV